ncbi:MAG: hypothetical protein RR370_01755 [Synergistaceae bacterium]
MKILGIDAKDLYIANHYLEENEIGYDIRDDRHNKNYRKFNNKCDNSLDLPKLRDVYEKACRRTNFSFTDGRHEYTQQVINVTFKYSIKEYNKTHPRFYVKFGYKPDKNKIKDCIWIENGELAGIVVGDPVTNPVDNKLLGAYFYYEDGKYKSRENFKVIMSTADLRHYLYEHSFLCDGIRYVRFKRSSGSSRVGKCLFINEKLQSRMHRWDMCGLPIRRGREVDLAGLESYISLTLSSIIDTIEIAPENILLIDDYNDFFEEDVVATRIKNERLITKEETVEICNNIWDGQSLLDSSLFEESGYKDKGMLLLRNRMFKSCCFNTNIHMFFKDNGIKHIEQLNGYTAAKKLSDIKLITTPSSIKYLKFGSFDKWLQTLNSSFGVVKFEKPTHYYDGKLVRTHYQLLNTLQMSIEDVEEFLKPSVEYVNKIREDPAYLKLHIGYFPKDVYSKPFLNNSDIVYTVMGINQDFCRTRWYSVFRANIVRKLIKELKCGKVLVNGNYSTLLGNPFEMLLESVGMFNGKSRIGIGCIHNTRFEYGKTLLGSRSPHVCMANVWLTKNTDNEEIERYFNLSDEIVCVNSIGESLLDRLSGADFDSDTVMLTDDPMLIAAAKKNYDKFKVAVNLVESKKTKRYYTPEEQADLDIKTSGNKIGDIVNLSQDLNSILWHKFNNGASISDVHDIYLDICTLDILSNLEIDKAKKEYVIDISNELRIIRLKYPQFDEQGKVIKPYFFAHISKEKGYYDKEHKNYKKFDTTMDYVQQIMNKVHIKKSKPEDLIDFVQCLHLDNFQINRVKYDQLYRIIDSVYRCSEEVQNIWANNNMDTLAKIEASKEEKIKSYEYINKIKLNQHTMYWLMASVDNPEYKHIKNSLISTLLMHGNSSFFNLIKISKKPMDVLMPDNDGNISILGMKFKKIIS